MRHNLRVVRASAGDDEVGSEPSLHGTRLRLTPYGDSGGCQHCRGSNQVGQNPVSWSRATNSTPYCSRPELLGGRRR